MYSNKDRHKINNDSHAFYNFYKVLKKVLNSVKPPLNYQLHPDTAMGKTVTPHDHQTKTKH